MTPPTTILCDADGTLFPSEEPAYAASAEVTRAFADRYGLTGDFSAEHLRRTGRGRNFRALSAALLADAGIRADPGELQEWIERERQEVTAHLARTLTPREDVGRVTAALHDRFRLAVVTSSASSRVNACLAASGLDRTFPPATVFSAEDSMPTPVSKPDPAIYLHALRELGVAADECLALEDSVTGTRSAIAAGIPTIGLVQFIPADEQARAAAELGRAGADPVVDTWDAVGDLLVAAPSCPARA